MSAAVRLGTRSSPLALAQASIVQDLLLTQFSDLDVAIVPVVSDGDKDLQSPLRDIGGKGVFIRSLEKGLLEGDFDIAVHSFKDITTTLLPGLEMVSYLEPESQCDVLIANHPLSDLRPNAVIGTGSLRRAYQLKAYRDDLTIRSIRGNVGSRMNAVDTGEVDGILLSEVGLVRLGMEDRIVERFDPTRLIPAPGQGVIALECRLDDADTKAVARAIDSSACRLERDIEWGVLKAVGFDCSAPFGLYVDRSDGRLTVHSYLASLSGSQEKRWSQSFSEAHLTADIVFTVSAALTQHLAGFETA